MKQATRFLFIILLVCTTQLLYGQAAYSTFTINDQLNNYKWDALLRKKTEEVNPVYLFKENYLLADLILPNGKLIGNNRFRLDLKTNSIYYLNPEQEQMELITPVKKIVFPAQEGNPASVMFEKGFPAVDKLNEDNFYQVLVSGKASLLLDTKFAETSRIDYSSGAPVKLTDKLVSYYGSNGLFTFPLTKNENLVELFADRSKEIAAYIQRENIKLKKRSDLEKLFAYYNSLF